MKLYGMIVEFASSDRLIKAAEKTRIEGYRETDAYTPFPVHGLYEAMGRRRTKLPWIILCGGLTGASGAYFMMWFSATQHYPLWIGGRPLHSWVSFIPITFECTVLFSAFTAAIAMLTLNGLPKPYHPLFNVPQFERASQDRFFLCIKSCDPKFDESQTRKFLESLGGMGVYDVQN